MIILKKYLSLYIDFLIFQAHDFQINLPKPAPVVSTSPFKANEGPAVPISTTSLLSNVPQPVYSSLAKSPQPAVVKSPQQQQQQKENNFMDKFKPKEGSWECGACMLRSDPATIQCKACEAPKPGHEEEVNIS